MNKKVTSQFLRFLLANSAAAGANIVTRLLSSCVFLDLWAVVAGFCVGLSTSYVLCRGFVFQSVRRASIPELLRFTGINLLALVITWIVYRFSLQLFLSLHGLTRADQLLQTGAHALGVVAPVLFSFVAQKTFTFRQRLESHGS